MDSNPTSTEILTVSDRCDQCAAQAYVQVLFGNGELLFCAHHWTEHEESAKDMAARIIDERHRLNPRPSTVTQNEEVEEEPQRRQKD